MQAAVQRHVDAAVSKTVNLPATATVDDVRAIYLAAWKAKVKGITVYRYGSREGQVLSYAAPDAVLAQADAAFSGGCVGRVLRVLTPIAFRCTFFQAALFLSDRGFRGPQRQARTMVHGAVTFGPRARTGLRRNNETMRHRTHSTRARRRRDDARRLPGAAEYARSKIGELGRLTHRPVLHAHVKPDQASRSGGRAIPWSAQANLDVDGAARPRSGPGRHRARSRSIGSRPAATPGLERGRRTLGSPAREGDLPPVRATWRHQTEPTRPGYFPRPVDERRVIRRKSFTLAPCTVDEAAVEMDLLDHDFHLFTEKGTAFAGVLYRAGPTGYRLALVIRRRRISWPHSSCR